MTRYDIAIVGTGPAGISAALTSKIRNKNIILLGNPDLSIKVQKAHTIFNYPGLPAVSGEEMAAVFEKQLQDMDIAITDERINAVYSMTDYFVLQGIHGMYEAKTVIISTGVNGGKPYPGEQEFLGRGVSYCATCDAPLCKGKTVAIVGFSPKEEQEAAFMAEVAKKVYYFPTYQENVNLDENIEVICEKPVRVEGGMKAEKLITDKGEYAVDAIFFLRESLSPAQLVPGLLLENNHIAVDRQLITNIPGCFACGDVTGTPYQYIKAAGEGNVAALSAVSYLGKEKKVEQ